MIRSFLIGLVSGARAMTPLAAVSDAARRGALPGDSIAPSWIGHPAVVAALGALAAGELWGDKLDGAPDRIGSGGLTARILSSALAGAALAPRRRALAGAALAVAAATVGSWLTFQLRTAAMTRFGQKTTGVVEDAVTVGAARMITTPSRA